MKTNGLFEEAMKMRAAQIAVCVIFGLAVFSTSVWSEDAKGAAESANKQAIGVVMFCNGNVRRASVEGNANFATEKMLSVVSAKAKDAENDNKLIDELLDKGESVKAGAKVFKHDLLGTMDDESHCQVNYLNSKQQSVRLAPNTRVVLDQREETQAKGHKTNLNLYRGKLRAKVDRITADGGFTVTTPVAVCGVRGTEQEVTHTPPDLDSNKPKDAGKTELVMYEGMVVAKQHIFDQIFQVRAGQRLLMDNFNVADGVKNIDPGNLRLFRGQNRILNYSAKDVHKVHEGQAVPPPMSSEVGDGGNFGQGFQQAVTYAVTTQFAPTPNQTGSTSTNSDPSTTTTAGTTPYTSGTDPNSPEAKIQDNNNFIGGSGSGPGTPVAGEDIPTVGGK
jgi:polyhydroxyalkanoate synthesis regulator phasin